ncbi:leucine-tRNA ligase [Aeropyrum pernix]|uniref:Leucine--tRNA ligase n=1 Tax=Aeropyrum pernix TaxID=56636 RepID=A0A401HAY8_AERPX|nr:leucine--tRNA ligase [Aeropyrum pernix]GBF09554.1 leucine-tRNA ligase [Aeropyrum pernix]
MEIRPRAPREAVERLKAVEEKWQERWREARLFEADPQPGRRKFFITFPYPYVNAYPHLGSAFTILRVDIMARYKRMRGYNVLFPQGWHATGGPIVSSALRVREGDPRIIKTLRDMGIPEEDIPRFRDPRYWVEFFTKAWRRDLERYGMSIDWRREFYTTSLNPAYSRFIEWQYLKLREKGFVGKGRHPVVWCPKEQKVVGDHDRPDEYAGIGPQEAVIIKFRGRDGLVYPALTYRPETVFGVTNLWVHPDATYLVAEVDGGERWIIGEQGARELADQGHRVVILERIEGRRLLGRIAVNPADGREVPVLPASFVRPDLGTGVVMSVPAHAPYDYVALMELKRRPETLREYGLEPGVVESLEPIQLIAVPRAEGLLVVEEVRRRGVESQMDREKLDEATREVYAREFYEGIMLETTGRFSGLKVAEAKEKVVEWLEERGAALRIYTLPQEVYCRCGARTHVKIVEDQWFLLYSKPEWKALAREAVARMEFLPGHVRRDFEANIEALRDWAFTHKGELGTPLPWDREWVIESLSDSTIYMAYYTIAKYTQHPEKYGVEPEMLTPEVFDYVFLGVGDPGEVSRRSGIPQGLLEEMRREFLYWYPLDMRISGKDLIPNHLVFFIFHHTAIFPRELWPRAIGVNGWVLVAGEKMSKSKGNFILLRQALDWWGADATRWAEVLAGADSGLDDANFEPSVADSAVSILSQWLDFVRENYGRAARREERWVDRWFESRLNSTIARVTRLMEEANFKTALVEAWYKLQESYRWYLRRSGGEPREDLLRRFIEVQTLLIAPFAPHTAEEAWEAMGREGFASTAAWPEPDESKISPEVEAAEETVQAVLEDAREVLSLIGGADTLVVTVAAEWKYRAVEAVRRARERGASMKEALREAFNVEGVDKREAARLVQQLSRAPEVLRRAAPRSVELEALRDAAQLLQEELGVRVVVETEEDGGSPRRANALPGRPALYAEKRGG